MPTFVFRLIPPRASFALDLTPEERALMDRHSDHWDPMVDAGRVVVLGPVMDGSGSWGLGVVEAEDEEEIRAFAAADPAVADGMLRLEFGPMLTGFVRTS